MYRKRQTSIFTILHPAATTSRTAPEQPRTPLQSYAFRGGAGGALYFCVHPPMAAPRLLVVRIVSARVQLLCIHEIGTLRGPKCPDEFFLTFSRRVQIRRGPLQATSWHFANNPDHLYTRKRTKMNKISTVRGSNSAGHSVGATRQVKFSVSKIQRGVAVCEHFDTHPLKFKSSNQRHFCRVSHSHRYCIDFGDFRTL